jgi:hypothetical protein
MEIEVDQRRALERDAVEALVEPGQQADVAPAAPGSAAQLIAHGRPADSLEHERIGPHLVDAWDREAVRERQRHHLRLGHRAAPVRRTVPSPRSVTDEALPCLIRVATLLA